MMGEPPLVVACKTFFARSSFQLGSRELDLSLFLLLQLRYERPLHAPDAFDSFLRFCSDAGGISAVFDSILLFSSAPPSQWWPPVHAPVLWDTLMCSFPSSGSARTPEMFSLLASVLALCVLTLLAHRRCLHRIRVAPTARANSVCMPGVSPLRP